MLHNLSGNIYLCGLLLLNLRCFVDIMSVVVKGPETATTTVTMISKVPSAPIRSVMPIVKSSTTTSKVIMPSMMMMVVDVAISSRASCWTSC